MTFCRSRDCPDWYSLWGTLFLFLVAYKTLCFHCRLSAFLCFPTCPSCKWSMALSYTVQLRGTSTYFIKSSMPFFDPLIWYVRLQCRYLENYYGTIFVNCPCTEIMIGSLWKQPTARVKGGTSQKRCFTEQNALQRITNFLRSKEISNANLRTLCQQGLHGLPIAHKHFRCIFQNCRKSAGWSAMCCGYITLLVIYDGTNYLGFVVVVQGEHFSFFSSGAPCHACRRECLRGSYNTGHTRPCPK